MTPRPLPHDPLSAEEREIADRLGHLASADGPSAALDARILSAARAATPTRPHAPRWPALLGIAATLAIAVGLVWQLRPATGALDVQDEVPAAVAPAANSRPTRQVAPAPDQATGQAAREATTDAAPPTAQRPPEPVRKTNAASPPGAMAPSPREMGPPSRQGAAAESAALDPGPPPMPAAASEPAPKAFPALTPPPPPRADRQQEQASGQASGDSMATQEAVAPSAAAMAGEVSEAEPLRPDAWLARIRQRRDEGDVGGARESLERFVRAHPDRPLPDDLRALLDAPAR